MSIFENWADKISRLTKSLQASRYRLKWRVSTTPLKYSLSRGVEPCIWCAIEALVTNRVQTFRGYVLLYGNAWEVPWTWISYALRLSRNCLPWPMLRRCASCTRAFRWTCTVICHVAGEYFDHGGLLALDSTRILATGQRTINGFLSLKQLCKYYSKHVGYACY